MFILYVIISDTWSMSRGSKKNTRVQKYLGTTHHIVLYSALAARIKHKYTRTSTKSKRGAGTPKNPKVILSRCP